MACPFFYPTGPLEGAWRPVHLPLGDPQAGECRAAGAGNERPGAGELQNYCNLGYARGRCSRFRGDGPDAVRFVIVRHAHSRVFIGYVLERDHLPHAHGQLEYDAAAGSFPVSPADANLRRQAEAYVQAYLRRTENPRFKAAGMAPP